MAVAFRSQAVTTTSNNTTHVCTMPVGVAAGDVLITLVNIFKGSAPVVPNTPSGWVKQADNPMGTTCNVSVFTRVATGSEGASLTLTTSASEYSNVAILAYSGGTGIDAFADYGSVQTSNTPTVPSLTTTVPGDIVVGLVGQSSSGSANTAASGWTERSDNFFPPPSLLVYAMDWTQAGAGASPTAQPSFGFVSPCWSYAVAVKAVAAAGPSSGFLAFT